MPATRESSQFYSGFRSLVLSKSFALGLWLMLRSPSKTQPAWPNATSTPPFNVYACVSQPVEGFQFYSSRCGFRPVVSHQASALRLWLLCCMSRTDAPLTCSTRHQESRPSGLSSSSRPLFLSLSWFRSSGIQCSTLPVCSRRLWRFPTFALWTFVVL